MLMGVTTQTTSPTEKQTMVPVLDILARSHRYTGSVSAAVTAATKALVG